MDDVSPLLELIASEARPPMWDEIKRFITRVLQPPFPILWVTNSFAEVHWTRSSISLENMTGFLQLFCLILLFSRKSEGTSKRKFSWHILSWCNWTIASLYLFEIVMYKTLILKLLKYPLKMYSNLLGFTIYISFHILRQRTYLKIKLPYYFAADLL